MGVGLRGLAQRGQRALAREALERLLLQLARTRGAEAEAPADLAERLRRLAAGAEAQLDDRPLLARGASRSPSARPRDAACSATSSCGLASSVAISAPSDVSPSSPTGRSRLVGSRSAFAASITSSSSRPVSSAISSSVGSRPSFAVSSRRARATLRARCADVDGEADRAAAVLEPALDRPGGSRGSRTSRSGSPCASRTSRRRGSGRACPPGRGPPSRGPGPGSGGRSTSPVAGWS